MEGAEREDGEWRMENEELGKVEGEEAGCGDGDGEGRVEIGEKGEEG